MNEFDGPVTQRRVRSCVFWWLFLEVGMFTSPPPSQGVPGSKSSRARGPPSPSSPIHIDFLGYRFSTHSVMRCCIDFGSRTGPKMDSKSIKNLIVSSIVAGSFFSGIKSLLELIFASTAGPANPYLEETLQHFLSCFRFSEDRVETKFEMIFDLPKASQH